MCFQPATNNFAAVDDLKRTTGNSNTHGHTSDGYVHIAHVTPAQPINTPAKTSSALLRGDSTHATKVPARLNPFSNTAAHIDSDMNLTLPAAAMSQSVAVSSPSLGHPASSPTYPIRVLGLPRALSRADSDVFIGSGELPATIPGAMAPVAGTPAVNTAQITAAPLTAGRLPESLIEVCTVLAYLHSSGRESDAPIVIAWPLFETPSQRSIGCKSVCLL